MFTGRFVVCGFSNVDWGISGLFASLLFQIGVMKQDGNKV